MLGGRRDACCIFSAGECLEDVEMCVPPRLITTQIPGESCKDPQNFEVELQRL